MHLERPNGGDHHGAIGLKARFPALDVEELLGAEIGAEARFRHHIVGELERRFGRDHRVAAMRDIGEGPAMNEGRVVLERLHQIRRERVLEQGRHGPGGGQILGGDGLLVAGLSDLDLAEAALEIGDIGGETENGHDLRGHGDVEAGLAREAVGGAAERADDRAQRPVVHVDGAAPRDAADVDIELVAPIDMVVDHRREQIVGGADGVEIAGEMEVDVLHRHDLRVAAAGSAPLHPEAGAERRLADADDGLLADGIERVAETDRGRGLAFAGCGRRDGRDEDQLAVGALRERGDIVERDLCLVMPVRQEVLGGDAELFGRNIQNGPHRGGLTDLDVGFGVFVLIVRTPGRLFGTLTRRN
jgi:hypothetical protein